MIIGQKDYNRLKKKSFKGELQAAMIRVVDYRC